MRLGTCPLDRKGRRETVGRRRSASSDSRSGATARDDLSLGRRLAATVLSMLPLLLGGCLAPARSEPSLEQVLGGGAADGRQWQPVVMTSEERELFEDARRLHGLGRDAEAARLLEAVLERQPRALPAHRLRQSILLRSPEDWTLREHYHQALVARPDEADVLYLAARIDADADRRRERFERAVELQPDHPYAWVGVALGYETAGDHGAAVMAAVRAGLLDPSLSLPWTFLGTLALRRAQHEEAASYFHEAVARDERDHRSWLGLARALRGLERHDEALVAALRAVELAPGRVGPTDALIQLLELHPEAAIARHGAGVLEAALPDVLATDRVRGLQGVLLLHADRPDLAEVALAEASPGRPRYSIAGPLRRARFRLGRYHAAVEDALAALPAELLTEENLLSTRWHALRHAAGRAQQDEGALPALADALVSVGWRDELRAVLTREVRDEAVAASLAARLEREERFDAFLLAVGELARELSDAARSGESEVTFAGMLEDLRRRSIDCLGRDVTSGLVERSYPFLGSFAVSVASDGPVEVEFGGRGLVLLVGRRTGRPPEITVSRMLAVSRSQTAVVAGQELDYDLVWTSADGLSPDLQGPRDSVAGLTLDRLVLLQVDALLADAPVLDPGFEVRARPVVAPEDLVATDTPSGVAARILCDVATGGRLGELQLDAVLAHELVHVLDARRMLPVAHHPLRSLSFVVGHGFDGAAAEQTLEGRAAGLSLVTAREPRLALAALLSFLPEREGETAHAAGYHEVLHVLLARLAERLDEFPALDPERNLVQQLDRLSSDDVRRLGRLVSEEL